MRGEIQQDISERKRTKFFYKRGKKDILQNLKRGLPMKKRSKAKK